MRVRMPLVIGALVVGLGQVAPVAADVSGGTPDDPLWERQWGPRQVTADQAWATSTGEGSTIAILDCGVDLDHEDLAANVVGGYDATTDGGDGDWDPDGDGEGCAHGTHVAGIAAAVGDNATGIVGVAPDAGILSVRVLGDDGSGSFEDIAEGIRWATAHGADVINMSLGVIPGGQVLSLTGNDEGVYDAIAEAHAAGVVVVAAAGNESFPVCDDPAFAPGVLCTTATDRREAHTWYSNGGLNSELLAVAAPGGAGTLLACGEEILSTVPEGSSFEDCDSGPNYEELFWFGTSMAAPHTAGAAGLLTSLGCTRGQTLDLITSTARTPVTGEPRGVFDPVYGYGIVDAAAAVQGATSTCAGASTTDGGGTDDGTRAPGRSGDHRPSDGDRRGHPNADADADANDHRTHPG
ncbi:MAG TPA: S8 family serine peptidase [Nitriliruptorales bacterium]